MQETVKTLLVAGAGAGIGAAVCRLAAGNGMRVIAVSRNAQHLERLRDTAICVQADLTSEAGMQQLETALRTYGMPDAVVLNLSTPSQRAKLIRRENPMGGKEIAEPLQYILNLMPAILQHQRTRNFGRWIGVGSMSSVLSVPGMAVYNMQKAAMSQLLFTLAAEEGRYGITANMVVPGMIDTPAVRALYTQEQLLTCAQQNVMHRIGTPEEVATAIVFLASDAAAFITGVALPVNGGNHLGWQYL